MFLTILMVLFGENKKAVTSSTKLLKNNAIKKNAAMQQFEINK